LASCGSAIHQYYRLGAGRSADLQKSAKASRRFASNSYSAIGDYHRLSPSCAGLKDHQRQAAKYRLNRSGLSAAAGRQIIYTENQSSEELSGSAFAIA